MPAMLKMLKATKPTASKSAGPVVLRGAAAMLLSVILAAPLLPSWAAGLEQDHQSQPSPPASDASKQQPAPEAPGESSSKRTAPGESVLPAPPGQPNYNPLDSEKDVEVGLFYMHKGDVDAAIPRFEDAIHLRANYAKPRLLLGEAYEKKHDYANSVKYYKEYLQVFPDAPDSKSVKKKIEQLSSK